MILKYLVVEDREKKRKEAIQQEKETHLERKGLKCPQNLPISPNPKPRHRIEVKPKISPFDNFEEKIPEAKASP